MTTEEIVNVMKHVTEDTFTAKIIESDMPSLVLFTSKWSGPSKIMVPRTEVICRAYKKVMNSFIAAAEENISVIKRYGIKESPSVAIFKDSKLIGIRRGVQSDVQLKQLIESHLITEVKESE